VEGQVTGSFGERIDPVQTEKARSIWAWIFPRRRRACDCAGGWSGRKRGLYGGYGRAVVLEHGNGVSTRYGHLFGFCRHRWTACAARRRDWIRRVFGRSTGPHLHYEVRIGDTPCESLQVFAHDVGSAPRQLCCGDVAAILYVLQLFPTLLSLSLLSFLL